MKINNEIIKRLMISCNYKTKTALAKANGMSLASFVNKQTTGTLWDLIINESVRNNVNINWIKTGQGNMEAPGGYGFGTYVGESNPTGAESQTPYNQDNSDLDFIRKTADILKSPTVYSTALKSNIEAFHHAMTCEKQFAVSNKKIDKQEEQILETKDRLPAAGE